MISFLVLSSAGPLASGIDYFFIIAVRKKIKQKREQVAAVDFEGSDAGSMDI